MTDDELIHAIEAIVASALQASGRQAAEAIRASKSEITADLMAYLDEALYKAVRVVADGDQMLSEGLEHIGEAVGEIKGELAALPAPVVTEQGEIPKPQGTQD